MNSVWNTIDSVFRYFMFCRRNAVSDRLNGFNANIFNQFESNAHQNHGLWKFCDNYRYKCLGKKLLIIKNCILLENVFIVIEKHDLIFIDFKILWISFDKTIKI